MTSHEKLVTLCLLTYNQEKYIADAIKGALDQQYSPLEIIISDDNSTDSTYEVILSIVKNYQGIHKIIINHNEINLGLVPHLNKLFSNYVMGEYILLAAGDDVSLPNRTREAVSLLEHNQTYMGVVFPKIIIDKNSNILNKDILNKNVDFFILNNSYWKTTSFMIGGGSAFGFRKTILNYFGKLNDDCQTEDSTLRLRCLLLGGIIMSNNYGILYRVHDNNISRRSNIYNLRTELIAKQYSQDIFKAYHGKLIDGMCFDKFQIKIRHYILSRGLEKKLYKSDLFFLKAVIFLYKKIVFIFYIMRIDINILFEKFSTILNKIL
jgi:glycosyltransferase involved in cell wall biosynthesis